VFTVLLAKVFDTGMGIDNSQGRSLLKYKVLKEVIRLENATIKNEVINNIDVSLFTTRFPMIGTSLRYESKR
jgi:hypothetical protein